jgi:hypothetical protein
MNRIPRILPLIGVAAAGVLAVNANNKVQIAAAGAICPLVALLSSSRNLPSTCSAWICSSWSPSATTERTCSCSAR